MFDITLLDHLRLTFGHVVQRHRAHSQLAQSRAEWSRWLKAAEALLMAAVTFAALGAAFGEGRAYAIASAVVAGIALATLLFHLTFDLDGSAHAHAWCATRLWMIREQYRAVLSDLRDGAIDLEMARERRDALMKELSAIYEHAPPVDALTSSAGSQAGAAADDALTEEEFDQFLAKSLEKARQAAT